MKEFQVASFDIMSIQNLYLSTDSKFVKDHSFTRT